MQDLTITGVDNGSLLVSSADGEQFRLPVDDALEARIRQVAAQRAGNGKKVPPREIQAHIRSGMSAQDVAALTGAAIESVQRFEGAILAERAFIVESALNVPVHTAMEPEPVAGASTFGSVLRARLADLDASDERWASWKEPAGEWMVKLSFTANDIDHDARWKFEPKRQALAPINGEAHTLSQQGEIPGALIPRLRAVGGDERAQDRSRFDSGAFDFDVNRASDRETLPQPGVLPFGRSTTSSPEATAAAVNRAPVAPEAPSQTADLLDVLRRRRGERESAAWGDPDVNVDAQSSRTARSVTVIDVPLDAFEDLDGLDDFGGVTATQTPFEPRRAARAAKQGQENESPEPRTAPQPFVMQARGGRKGRAAMPSWDEIVFGAKSDDDLA